MLVPEGPFSRWHSKLPTEPPDVPAALEPKVLAAHDPLPGLPSRKTMIYRKRQELDSIDLLEALRSHGIDPEGIIPGGVLPSHTPPALATSTSNLLPLESFFDTALDERPISAWQALIAESGPLPISVYVAALDRAFSPTPPYGAWTKGEAAEIADNGRVLCTLDNGRRIYVHRLYVHFAAESADAFAARLAAAVAMRESGERYARYQIYIDCVPPPTEEPLGMAELMRLKDRAVSTTALVEAEAGLPIEAVVLDVQHGAARAQSAFLMDNVVRSQATAAANISLLSQLALPPTPPPPLVPAHRRVRTPEIDTTAVSTALRAGAFTAQREAVRALQRVRADAVEVLRTTVFVLPPFIHGALPMAPQEFVDVQSNATLQLSASLRDVWIMDAREAIVSELQGCRAATHTIHLDETNYDSYAVSDTKRFLGAVDTHLAGALQTLLLSSIEAFVIFIEHRASAEVHVQSASVVNTGPLADPTASGTVVGPDGTRVALTTDKDRALAVGSEYASRTPAGVQAVVATLRGGGPLLRVRLVLKGRQLVYGDPPDELASIMTDIVDRALTAHSQLPPVEPLVMEHFAFLYALGNVLPSISVADPRVVAWRARLVAASERLAAPLRAYLATYEPLRWVVELDVDAHMAEVEASGRPLEELIKDVAAHGARAQEILTTIPNTIVVGGCIVDCLDVQRHLASVCRTLSTRTLDLIAARGCALGEEASAAFAALAAQTKKGPDSIESLLRKADFLKSELPEALHTQQATIDRVLAHFAALEAASYPLADSAFELRWSVVRWPRDLLAMAEEEQQLQVQDRERFLDNLLTDQDAFAKEVDDLAKQVGGFHRRSDLNKVADTAVDVKYLNERLERAKERATLYNNRESLFGKPRTDYASVYQCAKEFEGYSAMWLAANEWVTSHARWHTCAFEALDPEEVERVVTSTWKTLYKTIRTMKDRPAIARMAEGLKVRVEEFKPVLPTLRALRTAGLADRHWADISQRLQFDVRPGQSLHSLQDVYMLELPAHIETLTNVSELASKEHSIEKSLQTMREVWNGYKLDLVPGNSAGVYILRQIDELQLQLDDHRLQTQALSFSPFKAIFDKEIAAWEASLSQMQQLLDAWVPVQVAWLYLEPIFSAEDIVRQLPSEANRFAQVHRTLKTLHAAAVEAEVAMDFVAAVPTAIQQLKDANALLERVGRGLSDYLENKRSACPRFYFLSDSELLAILADARDFALIQPHLRKLFEGVAHAEMDEAEIVALVSSLGERVPLEQPLLPRRAVEAMLVDLELSMRQAVNASIGAGIRAREDKSLSTGDFMLSLPGQSLVAVMCVYWTWMCEKAISESSSAASVKPVMESVLNDVIDLIRNPLLEREQINLGALITIWVHLRDLVDELVASGTSSLRAFDWIKHLRYYWTGDKLEVRQVEAAFDYGCEYLGNQMRLVVTPLTDRIYLTLTGAMAVYLGSAPAGPAGTGKTETCKDLAKAMAKQCVVFNCQEAIDHQSMSKFFKGLANCGAWACFDEFNRIDVEVLSVIAQQVSTLQEAARSGNYRINFDGSEVVVDPSHSIFITMNPGYAGRTELPDNLKVLFRPVACMVPNYALIAQIRLYSFGYRDATVLANKMVRAFRLSSEQLSSQDHYDFGMRAVNTVINAAGLVKRADPDMPEDQLLLRALRDSNIPKFLAQDIGLFKGIIGDLFPSTEVPVVDTAFLDTAVSAVATARGFDPTAAWLTKARQIFETVALRHGMMVVGPAMSGKTAATMALAEALTQLADRGDKSTGVRRVVHARCNPKSITMGQLYGQFDETTQEWTDGILADLFRAAASDHSSNAKWVIFDGPVDAVWIESMNTVLDDNKKLCLVSGEIIPMSRYMTVVFETADLSQASPATVSRCGMIYFDPTSTAASAVVATSALRVMVFPLIDNAIRLAAVAAPAAATGPASPHLAPLSPLGAAAADPQDAASHPLGRRLVELVSLLVDPCIDWVMTEGAMFITPERGAVAKSSVQMLLALLQPFVPRQGNVLEKETIDILAAVCEPLFALSVIWSIGGVLGGTSRKAFSDWFRAHVAPILSASARPPAQGLIYDWVYWLPDRQWKPWQATRPDFVLTLSPNEEINFSDLLIPTVGVIQAEFVVNTLLSAARHVLVVGPTGSGKSMVLQKILLKDGIPNLIPEFQAFSAQTSANKTQDLMFSKLDRRRKGVFGPPVDHKICFFVDDVNMPQREQYGAQPPIELLRQLVDDGGWYERKTRTFYEVTGTVLLCACMPPGGGRAAMSERFPRHMHMLAMPEIDQGSLQYIYETIIHSYSARVTLPDVRKALASIVPGSIEVYTQIRRELLPRPSTSHYTFNVRDLAKVIQGVMSVELSAIESSIDVARLWLHETRRVFRDRLVHRTDEDWLDDLMSVAVRTFLSIDPVKVTTPEQRLIFIDWAGGSSGNRAYVHVPALTTLVPVIENYMRDFNDTTTQKLNLVLFADAAEHLCRITRILRSSPGGHALLLGVGGSGRQSLATLAAYICEYTTVRIEVVRGYGATQWADDLRNMLRECGTQQRGTCFILNEAQLVKESFLEDISGLLNTGEVPNLFDSNETEEVLGVVKNICLSEGRPVTKQSIWARFVQSCRHNLHIVLTMNPLLDAFRARLRMFPSLVSCTTIDWFHPWPDDGLLQVAVHELTRMGVGQGGGPAVSAMAEACVVFHASVQKQSDALLRDMGKRNYVTPLSFLELLRAFVSLHGTRASDLTQRRSRLVNGLEKLRETEDRVSDLQVALEQKQPILHATTEELKELMARIAVDAAAADVMKKEAQTEEAIAAEKQASCQSIRDEANTILARALPELEVAVQVLGQLHVAQISEVARYPSPPSGVKLVMQGICILLQIAPAMVGDAGRKVPDYWPKAKQLLLNPAALLQELFNFDRDNIPEKVIQRIEPLVKSDEFTPDKIRTASTACAAMCQWVHAMYKYYHVALDVAPKRVMLARAEEELAEVTEKLDGVRGRLKEVSDKLDALNLQRVDSEARSAQLEEEVRMTEVKLVRADRLVGGLASEKSTWTTMVADLDAKSHTMLGDIMIAAAQISYSGYFPSQYRAELLSSWSAALHSVGIPVSRQADIGSILGDAVVLRNWRADGLPTDTLSTENAIILTNSGRWPYLVDPQMQANKWVRATYKEQLEVLKPTQKDLLRKLEFAIRGGRPVLLESMGSYIDPSLDSILMRQTFLVGDRVMIMVGDTQVQYNDSFRLIMTTKDRRPKLTPESFVRMCVLDFQVTAGGLEEQLLGKVVEKERADLESAKSQLVVQNAQMQQELKELQDGILEMLEQATGDVLEDEALIDRLDASKAKSSEITIRVEQAEATERSIDVTRESYRPVAAHGTVLYFTISDLSAVDDMYQYSMAWYFKLFSRSIDGAPTSDDVPRRVENINATFTNDIYRNICRSLFERHKLLFSLALCLNIMRADPASSYNSDAVRFLTSGPLPDVPAMADPPARPAEEWLGDELWASVLALARSTPALRSFPSVFTKELAFFKDYFDSREPHLLTLPAPLGETVTPLESLLVVHALRPDRLRDAVVTFVSAQMGPSYVDPPVFDLAAGYRDSSATMPIIFVLSAGADPMSEFVAFADQHRMSKRYAAISLGRGQGPRAERLIGEAMESGGWVLLQNCHLATSWMPTLERLCDAFPETISPQFRLWCTTMPSPAFPSSVLQGGVKITIEPPDGLRANVTRSLTSVRSDLIEQSAAPEAFKNVMFALTYFHAMVQERRHYGALGFNIPYEFNAGDFNMCLRQLTVFVDKYPQAVPFEVLSFLFGQINYGGRVTDDWDRRLMMTLLDSVICPEALEVGYSFSSSGTYAIPHAVDTYQFIKSVQQWPILAEPEAYGLHSNAAITMARANGQALVDGLLDVTGGAGDTAGGGNTSLRDQAAIACADLIQETILRRFDIDAITTKHPTDYNQCLNTVLLQEALRFNRLLDVVHTSLEEMRKAVQGLVVMSDELEQAAVQISRNQVPSTWLARCYPTLKPLGAWAADLQRRCDFVSRWIDEGIPTSFWMSGLFFPQGFLTGTLQNFARANKISIDRVNFESEFVQTQVADIQAAPPIGVYVHGLYFEAARWSFTQGALVEAAPKQLFCEAPVLWMKPVVDASEDAVKEGHYQCPIYKTLRRAGTLSTTGHSTNFVVSIQIPTVLPQTHWVKRSAALICSLNY